MQYIDTVQFSGQISCTLCIDYILCMLSTKLVLTCVEAFELTFPMKDSIKNQSGLINIISSRLK